MRVDLTSAVRFDLPGGAVHTTGVGLAGQAGVAEERAILVPVAALAEALASAPRDTREHVARAIGGAIGRRAAARFGGIEGVRTASVDAVVESLTAEIALAGFGVLALERWGKALVVVLQAPPAFESNFFAPLLEAALGAATAWATRATLTCMHLPDKPAGKQGDDDGLRFLVARASSAEQVRMWMSSGVTWAEALRKLQRDGGSR
jgi:hypothetical protein